MRKLVNSRKDKKMFSRTATKQAAANTMLFGRGGVRL